MLSLATKGLGGPQTGLPLATKGYCCPPLFVAVVSVQPSTRPAWKWLPDLNLTGHEPWLTNFPTDAMIPGDIALLTQYSAQALPSLKVTGKESWLLNFKAAMKRFGGNN